MELAQYQLQIFVSLVVILGAAFVALIVDFLKGNNEQLRELALELRIRREEDQRRTRTLAPQTVPIAAVPLAKTVAPAKSERMEAPMAPVAAPAGTAAVKTARPMTTASADRERKRPSADALAVMERAATMAASPRPMRAGKPQTQVEKPVETKQQAEIIPPVSKGQPVSTAKKDWGTLLAHSNRPAPAFSAPVTVHAQAGGGSAVPAGFHEGFVLSQMVQNRRPVSGLVVSIGVNTPRNEDGSLPQAVKDLILSLIGPQDFACPANAEEYLLIYPNERGASAQRKLNQIAQQLWDFQLRSLGQFQILFSWGGVEVTSESIEEAIASANERMQETRRGRKLLTMEARSDAPLRKAV